MPIGWEAENSYVIQLKHMEEKIDERFIHILNTVLQPQKQISKEEIKKVNLEGHFECRSVNMSGSLFFP